MPLLALAVLVFAWLASRRQLTRVRRVPAWRSATAGVEGADCYTATGFANPAPPGPGDGPAHPVGSPAAAHRSHR